MTNLAEQALGSDRMHSADEICKMVDAITVDDVNAVSLFLLPHITLTGLGFILQFLQL